MFRIGCGAFMGDPYVVRLFLLAFQRGVNNWQHKMKQTGSDVGNCIAESPFTNRDVDLSRRRHGVSGITGPAKLSGEQHSR
eukprot:9266320-Pyramimonas_sp.AAC.1